MNTTDARPIRPLLFPDDQQFWYGTLRALGHTAYGRADIGEVVTTAASAQRTEAEARPAGRRPPGLDHAGPGQQRRSL